MKRTVDNARRRFFWQAGSALSAPLVLAAHAAGAATDAPALEARLALLEDMNAIRELQRQYVERVNAGGVDAAADLFVEPGAARAADGLRSLGASGEDAIEIEPGGLRATARLHCTAEIETPIEPSCPLVEMARAQGGGVIREVAHGVLEAACVKRDGVWRIERAEFRAA